MLATPASHTMPPRFDLPFTEPSGASVLLIGAGGGCDVICTVPIAVALRDAGCRVHLASYCTGDLRAVPASGRVQPKLCRVEAEPSLSGDGRFSEDMLARWWLRATGEAAPVWCFERPGVRSMRQALSWLEAELRLDAVVVVDGGVDGLFIGDEHDLGTPSMDAISIVSAWTLERCRRYYAFTAFGTEGSGREIRHADVLRRMAELIGRRGMLGVAALLAGSRPGDLFADALESVFSEQDPVWRSIIASSVAAAMRGRFGRTDLTPRTDWAPVWVSPLTLLYWFFELDPVARAKPYLAEVLDTDEVSDVADAIERVRRLRGVLDREDIPI